MSRVLTREARDTLWLLTSLALVLAPHAPRLPLWCSVGAALALLWRVRAAWLDGPALPRAWLVSLLVVSLVLTWLTYQTLLGRQAGITLVVMLTTLKCLELKARRDALVCLYLGFFLIFTQFLFSQSLGTAALMLLAVWSLLCSLVLGQRPLGHPPIREIGAEALRAMIWGLPLMVLLFVLFPRLGPLWSLPTDARSRTGLSESMQLGDVAQLAQDDTIALRVQFQAGQRPRPNAMYFRGPTLDNFDGRRWTPSPSHDESAAQFAGGALPYVMTLEPSTIKTVPLLEGTEQARYTSTQPGWQLDRLGVVWQRQGGDEQRLQIAATAREQFRHGPAMADESLLHWLRLPRGFNPRTVAWAQRWQSQHAQQNSRQLVAGVLAHIRQGAFRYTLNPGLPANPDSPHTVDDFWLDQQAGFCEHFAASFVVVMRAMGVPARIVTGYQGAELNPVDGQYIVRNSNAHAWAEIWSPGEGWVRVDPTAAVAPERIEQPPRYRPLAGLPGPLADLDPQALRQLRSMWEAMDHRWNVYVLQYSRDQQMNLLKSLGWQDPDWQALGQTLALALGGIGLGSAMWIGLERLRRQSDPWRKSLLRIHQALSPIAGEPAGPAGPIPASASSWAAHLQHGLLSNHGQAEGAAEALLSALRQLDALRYGGPTHTALNAPPKRLHRERQRLTKHIETLALTWRKNQPLPEAHSQT